MVPLHSFTACNPQAIRGNFVASPNFKGNIKYLYQGWDVFAHMWSSDIREMVDLFAAMVSNESEENLKTKNDKLISDEIQDRIYKAAGGQFMSLLAAATNPSAKSLDSDKEHIYAKQLVRIVEALQEIASFALNNQDSKNQTRMTIKKARRIEITSVDSDLSDEAKAYYRGLIRYGIFINDYRGKSVRGKIVPKLYLRSRLIPYFRFTFSKRDSITISWNDFQTFLLEPEKLISIYKNKQKKMTAENNLVFRRSI